MIHKSRPGDLRWSGPLDPPRPATPLVWSTSSWGNSTYRYPQLSPKSTSW